MLCQPMYTQLVVKLSMKYGPHPNYSEVIYAKLLQVIMIGGILFFVIEMKLETISGNNLAQLFMEFKCASSSP
jgi:hypothetical protein